MTTLAVLFAATPITCLAVLLHFTKKKVIDEPLQQARERHSPIASFVDDLQNHRWIVIIGLAVLLAIDKQFGFSGGWLQSRLVLAILITLIFVVRLLTRRNATLPPAASAALDPSEPNR